MASMDKADYMMASILSGLGLSNDRSDGGIVDIGVCDADAIMGEFLDDSEGGDVEPGDGEMGDVALGGLMDVMMGDLDDEVGGEVDVVGGSNETGREVGDGKNEVAGPDATPGSGMEGEDGEFTTGRDDVYLVLRGGEWVGEPRGVVMRRVKAASFLVKIQGLPENRKGMAAGSPKFIILDLYDDLPYPCEVLESIYYKNFPRGPPHSPLVSYHPFDPKLDTALRWSPGLNGWLNSSDTGLERCDGLYSRYKARHKDKLNATKITPQPFDTDPPRYQKSIQWLRALGWEMGRGLGKGGNEGRLNILPLLDRRYGKCGIGFAADETIDESTEAYVKHGASYLYLHQYVSGGLLGQEDREGWDVEKEEPASILDNPAPKITAAEKSLKQYEMADKVIKEKKAAILRGEVVHSSIKKVQRQIKRREQKGPSWSYELTVAEGLEKERDELVAQLAAARAKVALGGNEVEKRGVEVLRLKMVKTASHAEQQREYAEDLRAKYFDMKNKAK